MSGHERERVIIAGGSIAGLFAAALLRARGLDVDVFERSGEALASRGAGIVSHPELFDALQQVGVAASDGVGVEVVGRIVLDRDGSALGTHARPQVMLSWDRLYAMLRALVPDDCYHAGRAIEDFQQDADGVSVQIAGGARERADWLIGADGIRSAVRRRLLPQIAPVYAGYVAWRGLIEERAMSAAAWAVLGDRLMFCLPPGEQMLGYPVSGADEAILPGRRRYNVVWYRPADEARWRLLTGRDGRLYDLSIPPGQVADDAVAALYADADALLAPCCAEVVRLSRPPFIQAIYDLESPQPGVRPGRPDRRCRIRHAAACRDGRDQGRPRCAVAFAAAFAAPDRDRRAGPRGKAIGCATAARWSSAHAGSAPIWATRRARAATPRR